MSLIKKKKTLEQFFLFISDALVNIFLKLSK